MNTLPPAFKVTLPFAERTLLADALSTWMSLLLPVVSLMFPGAVMRSAVALSRKRSPPILVISMPPKPGRLDTCTPLSVGSTPPMCRVVPLFLMKMPPPVVWLLLATLASRFETDVVSGLAEVPMP